MNVAGFVLMALLLAAYVILDGWDFGVGALHLILARTDRDRAAFFGAIGPFWNGNEVFLIVAGAALFALFPRAYAASFSGFYLAFIIVLWLLMGRGVSIELRGHFHSDLWRGFWDVVFSICSAVLAFVLGLALGNIVRGLPLDSHGYFVGTFGFLLNGYSIAVGFLSLAVLTMHGAAFLWMRLDEGDLRERARGTTRKLLPPVVLLFLGITAWTVAMRPTAVHGALWIAPLFAVMGLAMALFAKNGWTALCGSSLFLLALVASAAGTIFPDLLPAFGNGPALDIYNSAPAAYSLGTAFTAAVIGVGAVLVYGTIAAIRMMRRAGT